MELIRQFPPRAAAGPVMVARTGHLRKVLRHTVSRTRPSPSAIQQTGWPGEGIRHPSAIVVRFRHAA
jgi:hypothetical protein